MCGLPSELSAEDELKITLNLDRIRWRKIDDLVTAFQIATGVATPPLAYFKALVDDPDQASKLFGDSLLGRLMQTR